MKNDKDILWDAERLGQFSNVVGPKRAHQFRAKCPDFFPPNFWRKEVRALPSDPIPESDSVRGLYGTDTSGMLGAMGLESMPERVPLWWSFKQRLRTAWQHGFPLEVCVRLISSPISPLLNAFRVWPYQRALMFLTSEPWRARFCPRCGERFVADKPARRFCSGACSSKARQNSRAASWKKHGEKWRVRYREKISSGKRIKKLMEKPRPRIKKP
jgi:hypothetical protein